MNKVLQIVLSAKDQMSGGLSSARGALSRFGSAAAGAFKAAAAGALAAGTALAGFAAKAISAYAEQEKAERSVIAAMNAHGEAGEALLPMYRRIADAIQDETGAADENTLASMANMRMLGVRTDQMEKAAKGLIGLKSAGMEGATAERAMAAAMQGNYEMLTRYIPALRGVTDEKEKQRIVDEFLERGYQQQSEQLNTLSGRWNALKGRVGDVWEEFGRMIAQNQTVVKYLDMAGDKVKEFGQKLQDWVGGGGLVNLQFTMQMFFADMAHKWEMAKANVALFFSVLRDTRAFEYLRTVARAQIDVIVEQFRYLGDWAVAIWEKIRSPTSKFDPPDTSKIKGAMSELLDAAKGNHMEETSHYKDALAHRERLLSSHQDKMQRLSLSHAEKLMQHQADVAKAAEEAAKAEAEAKAAAAAAEKQAKIDAAKEEAAELERLRQERLEKEKELVDSVVEAHEQGAEDVISAWKKAHDPASFKTRRVGGVTGTLQGPGTTGRETLAFSGGAMPTGSHRVRFAEGGGVGTGAVPMIPGTGPWDRGLHGPMSRGGFMNDNTAAIVRELKQINQNQQRLLTWG